MEWKDVTKYAQDDDTRKPSSLELRLTPSIVFKLHTHIWSEGQWLLSSKWAELDQRELHTNELDTAKERAVEMIEKLLNEKSQEIARAVEALHS